MKATRIWTVPLGTLGSRYWPSALVRTRVVEPTSVTWACCRGCLVAASVTRPVATPCAARVTPPSRNANPSAAPRACLRMWLNFIAPSCQDVRDAALAVVTARQRAHRVSVEPEPTSARAGAYIGRDTAPAAAATD